MSDPVTRLREIVSRLRAPDGCPWDREQTHSSLRGALLEETYELVDAIDLADDANLREELGDLLLHVVMHAQMAGERGAFEFDAVVAGICEKLIRRHPHVFGDQSAADSAEVLRQWEQIKRAEKAERTSVLDGMPRALPALMRAQTVQKKAARVGFDWAAAADVIAKIEEELAELRSALAGADEAAVTEETGDLLFSVVNLARKLGQDSEMTLNAATDKFIDRFKAVERAAAETNRRVEDCAAEELNAYWDAHKAEKA
ncbi:MAG: nucleoside triphosphate pyrophosphohydrolase [Terrimicrobiaceae bacterium]|nr:nucleoside triphosphate pyrophosphohydrolase [Terrimicrobiaceae bacterium]